MGPRSRQDCGAVDQESRWRYVSAVAPQLPVHDDLTRSQLVFSILSIAAAPILLSVVIVRLLASGGVVHWWVPAAVVAGMIAADFGSGLVHWFADTWGRNDLPVIGHRLIVPFRLHHVNPDDFLTRPFVATNGDVAFLTIPVILTALAVPVDAWWAGPYTAFIIGMCGIGMMTNQIHQWAHRPSTPRVVRVLQDAGLFLRPASHARHHHRPYDVNYCITTGWCNRPLEAIGFFRRLEAAITRATGAEPRSDDRRFERGVSTRD